MNDIGITANQPQDSSIRVIIIAPDQPQDRIDHYLSTQLERITRSRIQKLIKDGKVTVDQQIVKPSFKIKPGQTIVITFPPPPTYELIPQEISLNIVYEDESLLVINKQAGLVMHPAYANVSGTLVNALLYHSQSLSTLSGIYRPGIVHRLDKDTSGLLVIAKNDFVHANLAEQFSRRTILREYRALVWGHFKQKSGRIETLINRSLRDRTRMTISSKSGKPAITNYEVLEEYPLISLLRVRLETGRTHQIRVHLASKGHPVLGDPTYGGRGKQVPKFNQQDQKIALQLLRIMPRQALHAKTLGFIHPETGEKLLFDSELPEDIQRVIELLEKLRASRRNADPK